jgi:hypothetical protein
MTGHFQLDGLTLATLLLVIVTALSTLATFIMVRWMAMDVREKTAASLAQSGVIATSDNWEGVTISQTVINTGLSYLALTSATLRWWPTLESDEAHLEISDQVLPLFLAAREQLCLKFIIDGEKLCVYKSSLFSSPLMLITGRITYRYVGHDGKEQVRATNLATCPVPRVLLVSADTRARAALASTTDPAGGLKT